MPIILVVDGREHAVIKDIDATFCDQYICVSRNIAVGDYQICHDMNVLACIERKTYKDFAASFTDGRYKNIQKMIDMRASTNCMLYLILEGPAWVAPDHYYGCIPASSIETACMDMRVRDNIHVIMSRDVVYTANILLKLCHAYKKELGSAITDNYQLPPETIAPPPKKKFNDAQATMWAQLPGISDVIGTRLVIEKIMPISFLDGSMLPQIDSLKTHQGRAINPMAKDSLRQLSMHNQEYVNKLVGGIPGISASKAKELNITASEILSRDIKPRVGMRKNLPTLIHEYMYGINSSIGSSINVELLNEITKHIN